MEEKINSVVELDKLQKGLDSLKQAVSNATTDNQLGILNDSALQLASDANALITVLQPARRQIQGQLDVLGPPPIEGEMKETNTVVKSRNSLNARKALLDSQIEHAKTISLSATKLSLQIVNIRRNTMRSQMALNSGSILSVQFWSPVWQTQSEDKRRLTSFCNDVTESWRLVWAPEWRLGSTVLLMLVLIIWCFGSHWLDKSVGWFSIHIVPEGRLRRSFLAASTTLVTVVNVGMGAQVLYWLFTRLPKLPDVLVDIADGLLRLTFFSSLIAGLGRAFLSNHRPSWRLLVIPDPLAQVMKPLPTLLATCVLFSGAIEQFNNRIGTSVSIIMFGYGLSALLVASVAFSGPFLIKRTRRKLQAAGVSLVTPSPLVALIQVCITATSISILIALLIGYISLARFLTYELVWIIIVLSLFYLLIHLVVDLCEGLFSPNTLVGVRIKQMFHLNDRHLSQVAILLAAIGKTLLIMFGTVALINGNFASATPLALLHKVMEFWGGKGIENLNIIPAHVLNALIFLGIALYVLRSARRWLEKDFLPKTIMEPGMRSSVVTLFGNVGYVLIILLAISTLGIQWNNLAWIVSALSVGIGFGLQEIVKNFISGLILLTERPVKVGDLISISGIEGDIRRINVRATEIQLGDRSTVIVPNSQLISQNVRNATMGNVQGVATIVLTFPLDIDPEKVRTLLLAAYSEHKTIQSIPAPSVTFSQLTPAGIVLRITGFVSSPRVVASTKSDLLFEILQRLRTNGITLSMPQKMIVEKANLSSTSSLDS
ncbi:DUF3772 domain-containing protein [Candidatus Steffania adelgidicola]|uniref:DUF3772 domain-containing protein n=1 Tax=Candidatus Steffania adelgidicola TaxID=1076626 RepID=UPI001D01EE13|nr:DUF3772 domain-containing protein [Candidatus Steffania adelgidicola]